MRDNYSFERYDDDDDDDAIRSCECLVTYSFKDGSSLPRNVLFIKPWTESKRTESTEDILP